MIAKTAVSLRAGLLPAAAVLTLVCSFTARAEVSSAADKAGTTAAAEQTVGDKTDAAATQPADADKSAADKTAADKAAAETNAAGKDAAAKPADNANSNKDAAKAKVPEPELPKAAGAADKQATDAAKDATADKSGSDKDAADKQTADKDAKNGKADAAGADAKAAAPAAKDDTAKDSASTATPAKTEAEKADSAKDNAQKPAKADAASAREPAAGKEADADKAEVKDGAKKAATSDAKGDAKQAEAPATAKPPEATSALPEPSTSETPAPAGVADAVLPPADPVVAEVRQKLAGAGNDDETAALVAFYDGHNGPALWVTQSGLTEKGKAVVKEIGKADDWGLPASDFEVPHLASGSLAPAQVADAEIMVAKAILKYARYARGGRIDPSRISRLMDVNPPLLAPKTVLNDIAVRDQPDAYLRGMQPKHEQFERLRQVLLKLRGSSAVEEEDEPEDPALAVKLPPGRIIRGGDTDPQIALLRQRLKVPAEETSDENVYDEPLQDAVRQFQRANNLRPDAIIGNSTRAVLNGQPKQQPQPVSGDAKIQRILINMERWRWMPEDLGSFYVWDNVPEALTRVVRNGKVIHTDRIVVGQPSWPTPFFSADMKSVVFHPSWGVPPGIKAKELAPLLRKSSGGAGLFGIFGGGYSAQAVLDAYQLRAYINGRPVDANQIDWNSINIASVSFQQPPGPKNPLGQVKFNFPNTHDIYMHDTPERELFSRPMRALSHGCMRVNDPRKFAEIILGQDKGWSPEKVRGMFSGYSNDVALSTHIPVHVTYMTARVDDDGKLLTLPDFYGLDGRTAAALTGRNVRFEQPSPSYDDDDPMASSSYSDPVSAAQSVQRRQRKKDYGGPPTLADAISGLFSP